jgi:hypothetical protein
VPPQGVGNRQKHKQTQGFNRKEWEKRRRRVTKRKLEFLRLKSAPISQSLKGLHIKLVYFC